MTYREAAILSSEVYYNFLTETSLGIVNYKVVNIEIQGEDYLFTLSGKLFSPESAAIKIYNEIYSTEQFIPVEYDEKRSILKTRPDSRVRKMLKYAFFHHVAVISDLRFPVNRVENWYSQYGSRPKLPSKCANAAVPDFNGLRDSLSEDQVSAVEGVLSSPFSYVWGAPGTGKTRFVLARCVLAYIKSGKKVLITAPTNNALEQTLYGVLAVLEEAGIDLQHVFRLGTSSSEFACKYSSLCENISVPDRIALIDIQITDYKIRITDNDRLIELLPYFHNYIAFEKSLNECAAAMSGLFDQLSMLYNINTQTFRETRRKKTRINECIILLLAYTKFWKTLNKQAIWISKKSFYQVKRIICSLLVRGRQLIASKRTKYAELRTVTEDELYSGREECNNILNELIIQREEIIKNDKETRIRNCLVLAATVDTCLDRVLPSGDFKPDHVFLDEADNCSLIKGVTLTAYNCPVTFFGDHMQLKPVCAMKNTEIALENNAPVSLWAQSAIYTEDAFYKEPREIFADYCSRKPAVFDHMKKYDLIHTYRFGNALASVLAANIYPGLSGDVNHETDIYFINAIKAKGKLKRTNTSECNVISVYLTRNNTTDAGIITPYKNQRNELKETLRENHILEDSVLTVHGSQGREWDTVLFSVTDTTDMYFTDSLRNGKNIINTAVSRAKKKLILVCDVNYWKTQPRQLIAQLLSVAKEIVL